MVSKSYNTLSLFDNLNQLTPYSVGFDRQFNRLNDYVKHQQQSTGFPPYNIQKVEDFKYTIELALAGFSKEDIELEVAAGEVDDEWTLHRGISYRKFNRKFTLADDIIVNDAKLENGLLTITLEQIVPEEKKPRLIEIK
jgi:molecular chaperone IbpA